MQREIIFLIAFVLPFIYWRSLFAIAERVFDKPFLRTKTGLQIHHLHYGVTVLMVAMVITLVTGTVSNVVWGLFGLSTGLIMDEYIASMLLPGDRPLELAIYKKALWPTGVLLTTIVVVVVILFAVVGR